MKFSEVVAQSLAWLQREGRVSYRALRLEFDLTDDALEALKEELIEVKELAVDKDGKMLVWVGGGGPGRKRGSQLTLSQSNVSSQPLAPSTQRLHAPHFTLHVRRPSGGSSRSCSVTWWARRHFQPSLILKTCARSCNSINRPAPR